MGARLSLPAHHPGAIKSIKPQQCSPQEFHFVMTLNGLKDERNEILYLSDLAELTFDCLAAEVKRSTFAFLREEPDQKVQFKVVLSYIHQLGLEIRLTSTTELVRAVEERQKSGSNAMRLFAGIERAEEGLCGTKLKCLTRKSIPSTTNAAGIPATHPEITKSPANMMPLPSHVTPVIPATPIKIEKTENPIARKRKIATTSTSSTKKKKVTAGGKGVAGRILTSLMELRALNIPEPSKGFVALMAGYSNINSTGFSKQQSQLKKEGMVDLPSAGKITLTQKALSVLPPVEPPKTNEEVQYRLRSALKAKGAKGNCRTDEVFAALKDGRTMQRRALAAVMNYSNLNSTGFSKVVSHLSRLRLVEYPDKSSVRLTDLCFPYGRPSSLPVAATSSVVTAPTVVTAPSVVAAPSVVTAPSVVIAPRPATVVSSGRVMAI